MEEINKENCSVFCPCIKDTVKLTTCEECSDYKESGCVYEEKDKE